MSVFMGYDLRNLRLAETERESGLFFLSRLWIESKLALERKSGEAKPISEIVAVVERKA